MSFSSQYPIVCTVQVNNSYFLQACARGNLFRQKFQVMLEEWKQKKSKYEAKNMKEEEVSGTFTTTVSPNTAGAAAASEPAQPPPRRKSNLQVHYSHILILWSYFPLDSC